MGDFLSNRVRRSAARRAALWVFWVGGHGKARDGPLTHR